MTCFTVTDFGIMFTDDIIIMIVLMVKKRNK